MPLRYDKIHEFGLEVKKKQVRGREEELCNGYFPALISMNSVRLNLSGHLVTGFDLW